MPTGFGPDAYVSNVRERCAVRKNEAMLSHACRVFSIPAMRLGLHADADLAGGCGHPRSSLKARRGRLTA